MIRFLVNLVLFGLLFFGIYKFFPEMFQTLVVWIAFLFDFFAAVLVWLYEKMQAIIAAVTH